MSQTDIAARFYENAETTAWGTASFGDAPADVRSLQKEIAPRVLQLRGLQNCKSNYCYRRYLR